MWHKADISISTGIPPLPFRVVVTAQLYPQKPVFRLSCFCGSGERDWHAFAIVRRQRTSYYRRTPPRKPLRMDTILWPGDFSIVAFRAITPLSPRLSAATRPTAGECTYPLFPALFTIPSWPRVIIVGNARR